MALVTCSFNSIALPLHFQYNRTRTKRFAVEQTLSGDVVQQDPYYQYDETFKFVLQLTTVTFRNLFLNAFKDSNISYTFVDYDTITHQVVILEFTEEEVSGKYNLTGIMKRMAV